ncbi:unnamed protein product [Cutaneotrichosporon oleaginosum]
MSRPGLSGVRIASGLGEVAWHACSPPPSREHISLGVRSAGDSRGSLPAAQASRGFVADHHGPRAGRRTLHREQGAFDRAARGAGFMSNAAKSSLKCQEDAAIVAEIRTSPRPDPSRGAPRNCVFGCGPGSSLCTPMPEWIDMAYARTDGGVAETAAMVVVALHHVAMATIAATMWRGGDLRRECEHSFIRGMEHRGVLHECEHHPPLCLLGPILEVELTTNCIDADQLSTSAWDAGSSIGRDTAN